MSWAYDTKQAVPSLSPTSLFFLMPTSYKSDTKTGTRARPQPLLVSTSQGCTQRMLMAPLRNKRFFSLCSPAQAPRAVCTATYRALASSEFRLSRQQHYCTWKGSSNLYVLQFQERFSAVGSFEIELHREGGRTERNFLCLLSGSKFSYHFLIFHCW